MATCGIDEVGCRAEGCDAIERNKLPSMASQSERENFPGPGEYSIPTKTNYVHCNATNFERAQGRDVSTQIAQSYDYGAAAATEHVQHESSALVESPVFGGGGSTR